MGIIENDNNYNENNTNSMHYVDNDKKEHDSSESNNRIANTGHDNRTAKPLTKPYIKRSKSAVVVLAMIMMMIIVQILRLVSPNQRKLVIDVPQNQRKLVV